MARKIFCPWDIPVDEETGSPVGNNSNDWNNLQTSVSDCGIIISKYSHLTKDEVVEKLMRLIGYMCGEAKNRGSSS